MTQASRRWLVGLSDRPCRVSTTEMSEPETEDRLVVARSDQASPSVSPNIPTTQTLDLTRVLDVLRNYQATPDHH